MYSVLAESQLDHSLSALHRTAPHELKDPRFKVKFKYHLSSLDHQAPRIAKVYSKDGRTASR